MTHSASNTSYLEAILQDPELHFQKMQELLRAHHLDDFPTLPQMLCLPAHARATIDDIATHVSVAMEVVGQQAFSGELAPELFSFNEAARRLAQWDAGRFPLMFCARFDGFFDAQTQRFQLMECNAGDPSGAGYTDLFLDLLMQLPATQQLMASPSPPQFDWLLPSHIKLVTEALQRTLQCAPSSLHWAQLSDPESLVHRDHLRIVEAYQRHGINIRIADPREFAYNGNTLSHQGQPIQVLLRDTVDELILGPHWPDTEPILQAYQHGHVTIFNPFSTTLADFKGAFEPLSTPSWTQQLPSATRRVVESCIPWTRVIRERNTDYKEQTIDLVEYIRTHRSAFVLKPNEGFGGFGVLIGTETSQQAWEEQIEESLENPGSYVVQEHIPPTRDFFVMPRPPKQSAASLECRQEYTLQEKNTTLSFWVHAGKWAGCFARISDATVINVHQGGALIPCCFLKDFSYGCMRHIDKSRK